MGMRQFRRRAPSRTVSGDLTGYSDTVDDLARWAGWGGLLAAPLTPEIGAAAGSGSYPEGRSRARPFPAVRLGMGSRPWLAAQGRSRQRWVPALTLGPIAIMALCMAYVVRSGVPLPQFFRRGAGREHAG